MSTPCARPLEPHTPLGTDGGEDFIAAADGEVYRHDGIYWRWYSSHYGWPSCSTARRIARRHEEEATRRRERAVVTEIARKPAHGRRVR